MSETQYIFSVNEQLKQAFESAAQSSQTSGAELIRQFMQTYVEQTPSAEEYDTWFRQQVAIGLAEIEAGQFVSGDEVEAKFALLRAETKRQIDA